MNRKLMTLDKGVEWLGPSTNISTFANLETTLLRKNYSWKPMDFFHFLLSLEAIEWHWHFKLEEMNFKYWHLKWIHLPWDNNTNSWKCVLTELELHIIHIITCNALYYTPGKKEVQKVCRASWERLRSSELISQVCWIPVFMSLSIKNRYFQYEIPWLQKAELMYWVLRKTYLGWTEGLILLLSWQ